MGFANRTYALQQKLGGEMGDLTIMKGPVSLTDPYELESFVQAVDSQTPNVVFIDTLARSFGAGDENSTADMNRAVAGVSEIVARTGAALVLVHHAGKNSDLGMRGSNALLAGVDQVLKVEHDQGQRWMQVTHSRDGEAGASFRFGLEPCVIGQDEEGEPIVSCLVSHLVSHQGQDSLPPQAKAANLSANQSSLYHTICSFILEKEQRLPYQIIQNGGLLSCQVLQLGSHLVERGFIHDGDDKQVRTRALSKIRGLIDKGLLATKGGWVWQPKPRRRG